MKSTRISSDRHKPTILSKHSERSDELDTRCVHRDEDHAVLAVPKKQVETPELYMEDGERHILSDAWSQCAALICSTLSVQIWLGVGPRLHH